MSHGEWGQGMVGISDIAGLPASYLLVFRSGARSSAQPRLAA